ncbi:MULTISPECIES: EAL domain-containing protein [Vibrio]|uniref:EAL domain-containing protein n=1 Tax=Vibrio TaxID=662 RepID=UPI000A620168|nr:MULTISPECIES: EAL domain-containing protein [Vibrio]QCI73542.1 EAL domain-containing protein [Vibrio cyclitrophicus]
MFKFLYHGHEAHLHWYAQQLITASLTSTYGQELLTRGFYAENGQPIHTGELINYLTANSNLLLDMTIQQLDDLIIQPALSRAESKQVWINISGKLIADNSLFDQFWQRGLSQVSPNKKPYLVLEICEDSIDDKAIVERINQLQNQGFKVAMDDFGSGHSNLIRLSQINFDYIKLDLELIKRIPDELWSTSLYKEIIELCSSKGALIVAEGVENQPQSDFIRWAGVDIIQGFLYSKPQPIHT